MLKYSRHRLATYQTLKSAIYQQYKYVKAFSSQITQLDDDGNQISSREGHNDALDLCETVINQFHASQQEDIPFTIDQTRQIVKDIVQADYTPIICSDQILGLTDFNNYHSAIRQAIPDTLFDQLKSQKDHLKYITLLGNHFYAQLIQQGVHRRDLHQYMSFALWECGLLWKERNAMYNIASVLLQRRTSGIYYGGGDGSGQSIKQNQPLAHELLTMASDQEHPNAIYLLGTLYLGRSDRDSDGNSFQYDDIKAVQYLHKALDLKVYRAYNDLAAYHLKNGRPGDAVESLQNGVQQQDIACMVNLGNMYATGGKGGVMTVNKSITQAIQLWSDAAKSYQLSANLWEDEQVMVSRALLNLGNCYFLGLATGRRRDEVNGGPNYTMAKQFWDLSISIDPHNVFAYFNLASLYIEGVNSGGGGGRTLLSSSNGMNSIDKNIDTAAWYLEQLLNVYEMGGGQNDDQDRGSDQLYKDAKVLYDFCLAQVNQQQQQQQNVVESDRDHSMRRPQHSVNALDSILNNIRQTREINKRRNKSLLSMFFSPDNPDYEVEHMKSMVDNDESKIQVYQTLRNRWKYVERFLEEPGNSKTTIKSDD
ncbi:hypothetical protein MP228_001155 [Amoeboaphelidium protococcarum]|nr:hypothetical protein MP228_001155 [Amoeboaphelidium protococcarum]